MQAREADAWREYMEAGSEEEQEARREEVAGYARESRPTNSPRVRSDVSQEKDKHPAGLAARAAGMSRALYARATYVLDPAKGENDIQQSELPPPTKSALVRQIREDRAKLEADEISPTAAERRARESKSARSWRPYPSNTALRAKNKDISPICPARTYAIRQIYP